MCLALRKWLNFTSIIIVFLNVIKKKNPNIHIVSI